MNLKRDGERQEPVARAPPIANNDRMATAASRIAIRPIERTTADRPSPIRLSVIVPAFNESARLGASLERLVGYLRVDGRDAEVIVVDDGSDDGTADLAVALHAAPGVPVRVLRHARNRGKGAAVRTGVRASRGRLVVFLDADLSTPPEDLPRLLQPLEAGEADVVIGSRRAPGADIEVAQSPRRALIGSLFRRTVTRTLLPGIHDSQCGFKGFRREAALDLFERTWVRGFGFDVEVLFAARRLGLRVREVPVRWRDDARSTVRPVRDGVRMVGEVGKILVGWAAGWYGR